MQKLGVVIGSRQTVGQEKILCRQWMYEKALRVFGRMHKAGMKMQERGTYQGRVQVESYSTDILPRNALAPYGIILSLMG